MHLLLVIAMVFTGLGGTAATVAAQDSLPGEALYGLKTATEQVKLVAAFSDESKAAVHLEIAARRAEEMGKALDKNDVRAAEEAAKGFGDAIAKSKSKKDGASTGGPAPAPAASKDSDKNKDGGSTSTTPATKPSSTTTTPATNTGSTNVITASACDDMPGKSERGILAKLRASEAAAGRGRQNVVDNLEKAIENQLRAHGLDAEDLPALRACLGLTSVSTSTQTPSSSTNLAPSSSSTGKDAGKKDEQGQNPQAGQSPQGSQNPGTGSSQDNDGPGKGKGQGSGPQSSAPSTGPGNSQGRGNR